MAIKTNPKKKSTTMAGAVSNSALSSNVMSVEELQEDEIAVEEDDQLMPISSMIKAAAKKVVKADEDEDEDEAEDGKGDDDADDDAEDEVDEWEKGEEEEEEWDPDFEEFDIPKSKGKKGGGKGDEEEEDDFKLDEDLNEFDDLFGDGGDEFDDDDY